MSAGSVPRVPPTASATAGTGENGFPRVVVEREVPGVVADDTRAAIFAEVLTAGPASRTELARRLGLSQSTVTRAVNPLIETGYLREIGARASEGGRPQRILAVARDRHLVLGVKLAPQSVTAVLTDLEATIVSRSRLPVAAGAEPEDVLTLAAQAAAFLLAADHRSADRLLGAGVGLGGHVDSRTGRCVRSGVLGWEDVDVAGPLSAKLGLPVVVNNDANALLVAERWFGAGRDSESLAVVTVGAGIGCGLLIGGGLYAGSGGLAGELGHVPVQPDGPPCSCGNRGCLESVAADPAILRAISEASGVPCASISEALARAATGESAALEAFAVMGEALGRALATLCNLVNPQKIVLTGESLRAYEYFGPACRAAMAAHGFSTAAADCELVAHPADDDVWARGAACLAIREAVQATR
ncbi:ROK family transcriptional regulator [Streptomyces sp. DSM 44917]|uniref:ROK family transcriptional regulator n=1 Tax=Streptomyces boetiae TaxID=3075541 RepID=A0ABU2LDA0_9ACTN|nr:ROK family transcriptional regulator [Streptomyces sp. DSM 44917]MDT0309564.1 ROK family transcriptional regulator [Streptomyces sp. DSM 44917]